MKMHYNPANEELVLINRPVIGNPSKKVDHFKFWYDDEGNIYALAITRYTEELKEFRKNLNIIQLGGLLKGVTITDKDIRETRKNLLKTLEEKW
jgi:hypothetical protein